VVGGAQRTERDDQSRNVAWNQQHAFLHCPSHPQEEGTQDARFGTGPPTGGVSNANVIELSRIPFRPASRWLARTGGLWMVFCESCFAAADLPRESGFRISDSSDRPPLGGGCMRQKLASRATENQQLTGGFGEFLERTKSHELIQNPKSRGYRC
jgi:hypothetical protein